MVISYYVTQWEINSYERIGTYIMNFSSKHWCILLDIFKYLIDILILLVYDIIINIPNTYVYIIYVITEYNI